MGHFYAKSSNIGILNPLNPPYQGDFKSKCVSPKIVKKYQFVCILHFFDEFRTFLCEFRTFFAKKRNFL